jgi:signal recognition particle subunit SRP54
MMFDKLSDRLGGVFDRLRGRGALNENDVREAMREVRVALLEADVALPVARDFVEKVTEQAVGQSVLKSVTPGQQVVKIVNDALVEMLGSEASELNLAVAPPAIIMMVGLQGSGKTTTTAKIAKLLKDKERKKVMMASLDVNRPAAQAQLATLGTQIDVATLPIVEGQQPVDITKRALQAAKLQGFDVLLLDTAGRLHVDQQLMDEMRAVANTATPQEILLVVDSLTGRSNLPVSAKKWMRLRRSTRHVLPAAFSAWATWSAWLNALPKSSRKTKPKKSPQKWRRGSSISTICGRNCVR